ncbi:conserved hypothetical protein [Ricinus communis]|uniref:DCD domain-containing protein n=1 Tax=Ricinus communis TaxID=3988 RepID=B9SDR7_RICCO|nr:conserved hypothetical protein [Ricinus communis]
MKFDRETHVHGQFPEFGAIFMSNNATKKECFRRKLLGLPSGQTHFVKQVKARMILFLFEFERRELHGVFQACTDGAINIVPNAFKSSGKQFPAQVQQLLSLFGRRKLKDKNFDRHFTQSKGGKQIGLAVNITRKPVDDGRVLAINNDKDEETAIVKFVSGSSKCSGDYVDNYIRAIDADMSASTSVGHGHKTESDFGMQQFGKPLGRIGRSFDDIQFLEGNEIGNKHAMNIDPMSVSITDYSRHPFTIVRSIANHVSDAMISGLESKWDEHDAFQPRVSAEHLDLFQSNPSAYSSKSISEEMSLMNDQLQQSSAMDRSVAPQNLNSYSISSQDAVVTNSLSLPYDPDVPALNYMYSWPPELSSIMYSVCERKRESVFSRLALPADLSEQGVGHVECGIDSSVDDVMAMLHLNGFNGAKAKRLKKLNQRQADMADLRKKRQVTGNSKERDKHQISSGEEEVIQKVEQIPFLDFKRRSEARKFQDDANGKGCNENVEKSGSPDGQRKRRKLIRPNFSTGESSDDVMVGSKDKRSHKLEIMELDLPKKCR